MKHLTLIGLLLSFTFGLFAQNMLPFNPGMKDYEAIKVLSSDDQIKVHSSYFRENIVTEMWVPVSALHDYNGLSNRINYITSIWPDTMVYRKYTDMNENDSIGLFKGYHSMVSTLDPRSEMMEYFQAYTFDAVQPYTVDTVWVPYWYIRGSDNTVTDHIDFYYYGPSNVKKGGFSGGGGFNSCGYDRTINGGKGYEKKVTIDLTEDDAIHWDDGTGYIPVPINESLANGGAIGLSWSYRPGTGSVKNFDTLVDVDDANVYKKVNRAYFAFYYDEFNYGNDDQVDKDGDYWCNGGFVSTYINRFANDWGTDIYIPGTAFYQNKQYPVALFQITYDQDWVNSVEDLGSNAKIGDIYPNPTTKQANINVELTNSTKVTVEIINTLGQNIDVAFDGNLNAGKNTIEINTSNLQSGLYFCKISADGSSLTKRIIVR